MSAITTDVSPIEDAPPLQRILDCEDLRVGYDGRALLPGVAFSLYTSQLWAIVGDNGSGKTTLLKTLLGLQSPLSGDLRWQDLDRVGYVPQRARLDLSAPARVIDVVRGGVDRGWSFLNPFHINKHREAIAQAMRDTNTSQLAEQMFS
ncbi:MAG: ATP-binding cassette domain-containing protein, partial [Myxococcota bacterium]|nr:ATP-binding cassette domain-containing protein [Myxococcota bacterium]